MQPFVAVNSWRSAGLALQIDDGCSVGKLFHDQSRLCFAPLDVVRADVRVNPGNSTYVSVHGNHWNSGVDRLLESGRHRIHINRADDDSVHSLDDGRFHVSCLFGDSVLTVGRQDFNSTDTLGFLIQLLLHVDKEGEFHAR